jgi:hypothetical protein
MKEKILLVGEDPDLLATRAFLLSAWETQIENSLGAIAAVQAETFAVVIVGQLVSADNARLLIDAAQKQEAAPEILVIRDPEDEVDLAVETYFLDLRDSPAWLEVWVRAALSRRHEKRRSSR